MLARVLAGAIAAALALGHAGAASAAVRAVFVGIDEYENSRTRVRSAGFDDLSGAVRDVARIKLRADEGVVVIDVEDNGAGIPADQREAVFEPFVRLNEEGTRGAGLGLAAARSIARAHGGDIVILDAESGALIRVTLPG